MANGNSNVIPFPVKPIPRAIHLTAKDTGIDGIRLYANIAETLGIYEDWQFNVPIHATVLADAETGEPILKFRKLADDTNKDHYFCHYDQDKNIWKLNGETDSNEDNEQNIILCFMDKLNADAGPQGITITEEDTGTDGIDVLIVNGECYGDEIEWYHKEVVRVVVKKDFVTGLPNLYYSREYLNESGETQRTTFKKRGYEIATKTWWRYEDEVDPTVYREHCLRILKRV